MRFSGLALALVFVATAALAEAGGFSFDGVRYEKQNDDIRPGHDSFVHFAAAQD